MVSRNNVDRKRRLPVVFEGRNIDHLHDSTMIPYGWKIRLHMRLLFEFYSLSLRSLCYL